jgi:hypothetical protein
MHYVCSMRKIVAGAACLPLCLAAACGSSATGPVTHTGSLSGKTASQVVLAATSAANALGSVHYELTASQAKQSESVIGDATTSGGRQEITIGALHIQVVIVGGVAYAQGNSTGLQSFMGIPSTQSSKYADKWIAVHQSDSLYAGISQAVTLSTALDQLTPSGKLKLTSTRTVQGREALGVQGGLPGPAQQGLSGATTLYVATSKPTVPLSFSENSTAVSSGKTQHEVSTGAFTHWGEHLHLSASQGAVAFSSIPTK